LCGIAHKSSAFSRQDASICKGIGELSALMSGRVVQDYCANRTPYLAMR
jgi:hypothetical protein